MSAFFRFRIKKTRNNFLWLLLHIAIESCMALHSFPSIYASGVNTASPPMRIASGTVASDEILWSILSKAGKTEKLQAVSTLSDSGDVSHLTPWVKTIPGRVGGSPEHILSVKPDLVIMASFNRPELIKNIQSLGMSVWIMQEVRSFITLKDRIRQLGELIHERPAAEMVISEFEAELAVIRKKFREPPARVIGLNPDRTVWGSETLFDDILSAAGGQNILRSHGIKGWPRISSEFLAALSPDWVVMSAENDARKQAATEALIRSWPETRSWPALQKNQIIFIPAKDLHAVSPWLISAVKAISNRLNQS